MNIDQALTEIFAYSADRSIDGLSAIEQMVKDYKNLSTRQQEAVTAFMEKTKEPA